MTLASRVIALAESNDLEVEDILRLVKLGTRVDVPLLRRAARAFTPREPEDVPYAEWLECVCQYLEGGTDALANYATTIDKLPFVLHGRGGHPDPLTIFMVFAFPALFGMLAIGGWLNIKLLKGASVLARVTSALLLVTSALYFAMFWWVPPTAIKVGWSDLPGIAAPNRHVPVHEEADRDQAARQAEGASSAMVSSPWNRRG